VGVIVLVTRGAHRELLLLERESMAALRGGFEVVLNILDSRGGGGGEGPQEGTDSVHPSGNSIKYNSRVYVAPSQGSRLHFTIEFSTQHYAFTRAASSTVRNLDSFYGLHAILKVMPGFH
jgi:hypothetical protein